MGDQRRIIGLAITFISIGLFHWASSERWQIPQDKNQEPVEYLREHIKDTNHDEAILAIIESHVFLLDVIRWLSCTLIALGASLVHGGRRAVNIQLALSLTYVATFLFFPSIRQLFENIYINNLARGIAEPLCTVIVTWLTYTCSRKCLQIKTQAREPITP